MVWFRRRSSHLCFGALWIETVVTLHLFTCVSHATSVAGLAQIESREGYERSDEQNGNTQQHGPGTEFLKFTLAMNMNYGGLSLKKSFPTFCITLVNMV